MDKMKFIPSIAPTSSGRIDFYLRLDRIIAIAYANDPGYKDNYFVVFTKEDDDSAFYYVHKHIIRKYFDLEQMPADEIKPMNNECGFDETSTSD